ncbi:Breast cancer type 2 susceptibility [Phytophthora citrophthora]|uniref:Breast cancer type 2 susceptibility n=1 Tax=Phytophthora citrophthora TaxID=4793 RepID=A0AAD9LQN8_9STRA|nr:Breast cancer type 2 susceptibility [Phytophthora citrophthora]
MEGDVAWRAAFDELLVFQQDFDTAMQILMFQDEKVGRLALEDAQDVSSQRTRRRAKTRRGLARSPSRKRRRTETSQTQRSEPPSPPLSRFTQDSDKWSQSTFVDESQTQDRSLSGITEATMPTHEEESVASASASASTSTSNNGTGAIGAGSSVSGGASTVPSLFTTGSGKTVSVSASRLRAYEEKLRSEEESVASASASASTSTSNNGTGAIGAGGGASTVPSLFTTGSGKTVSVSASRLRAYEEKLRSEEESVASASASASTSTSNNGTGAIGAGGGASTVPSLFTTGSGKTVSVSASRLRAYEEKLRSEEESVASASASTSTSNNGTGAIGAGSSVSGGASTVPSLFTTGSGKTVSVSASRLRAYEEKLRSEEESVASASASASTSTSNNGTGAIGAGGGASTVPSLFTTGSGKTVSVSASRLRAYEEKLRSEEESVASASASASTSTSNNGTGAIGAGGASTVPSLFTTGSGKTVSVSASRLRAYEEKLRSEEESVASASASTSTSNNGTGAIGAGSSVSGGASTVPSLFTTGSGKTVSVSASRLRAYEEKLRSEEESVASASASASTSTSNNGTGAIGAGGASTVPSLFTTGSGKTVSVSASRLRAYEEKLRSEEESVASASASTSTSNNGTGAIGAGSSVSGGASTVPSLFTTGSGKTVSVSASRLRAYEEKLRSEEESVASASASASTSTSNNGTGAIGAGGGASTVPSLFTTGSGKTVSVSASRLRAYEEKLRSEEESVASASASASTSTSNNGTGAIGAGGGASTVPSLFTTGSGKTVSVSASRLRAYEEKLRSEEESVASASASASTSTSNNGTGAIGAGGASTVPSLFTTGSGKTVSVSASRLRAYEEKLRSEEESVASASASASTSTSNNGTGAIGAGGASTVPSLFTTGSGKTVSVSASRLRAYEEKLRSVEESVLDSKPASEELRLNDVSMGCGRLNYGGESTPVAQNVLIGDGVNQTRQAAVSSLRHERKGLAERKISGSLGDNSHSMSRHNGVLIKGTFADDAGDSTASSTAFSLTELRNRHGQEHHCGDKENVHPEIVLVRNTAALEACKASRSTPIPKLLHSRLRVKYPEQHETAKQKLSIEPRSKTIRKRRFNPPVASKRLCASNSMNHYDTGRSEGHEIKKRKVDDTETRSFIYQESMKISLTTIMELRNDHTLDCGEYDPPRLQVLKFITAENASSVLFTRDGSLIFSSVEYIDSDFCIGPLQLYRQLRTGQYILKKAGATFEWFFNHYRWIVWKLAATERSSPRLLLEKYLTKDQILKQICHRYQRELDNGQRSILKKIVQRDASSLSCMTLCIAAVLPFPAGNNSIVEQELPVSWNLALVLTDGWYSVYAVPDAPLAAVLWRLHTKSSLVGTKIATWNASLQNSSEGIDPLECAIVREKWKNPLLVKEDLSQWPYLQLRYNSTRRVRFDMRLGVEKLHYMTPTSLRHRKQQPQLTFSLLKSVPLKSLEVGGGMVRSVRVRVTRISPVLHLQSKEWTLGPRILCEEQLPLYFELRSEYARIAMEKKCVHEDVSSRADNWLSNDQTDVPPPIPFIKVDVECTHGTTSEQQGIGCGILTIWRPSEELLSGGLREGSEYFASSLTVNWKIDGGRGQDAFLRLSSTKHTGFEEVHNDASFADDETKSISPQTGRCVDIQQATMDYRSNFEDGINGRRNERRPTVDVCVCVVAVAAREPQEEANSSAKRQTEISLLDREIKPNESRYVEHVFVTDQSGHLMSIRVSGMEVTMQKKKNNSPLKRASSPSFVFRRGSKSIWKEGVILCLSGLEVSHYDEQLRILDCVLVESTQIVSFPSKKSPFWDHFQLLQRESGISTTRGSPSKTSPTTSNFAAELAQLKKYVERDILRMDFVPSQDCNEHHVEAVEQERLTQDLQAHEEGSENTSTELGDDESSKTQSHLLQWDANIVKIMPLVGPNKFIFSRDVVAIACVKMVADDITFRTVYLTQEVLLSMQALLQKGKGFCYEEAKGIVQGVSAMLQEGKEQNGASTFRFEVRQCTNERLMNSWKPWERQHASYWLAATVAPPQQ